MALFQKNSAPLRDTKDQYFRTNTKLQAGTHDAPGEKFLVDPRLKRLFRYHFGGDGWVVIPKGRAVAPASNGGDNNDGRFKDFDSNAMYNALTLANGGVDVTEFDKDGVQYIRSANRAIGVAYANLYEYMIDGFNGMQPTVENEIYIELPYIPRQQDAEQIEWGAFYDRDMARPVRAGDHVIPDENGRLVKADFAKIRQDLAAAKTAAAAATDIAGLGAQVQKIADLETELSRLNEQTMGQVWAVETNLPPEGWLQWVMWSVQDVRSDDHPTGFTPNDVGAQAGFPGYPYENSYAMGDFARQTQYQANGIPGLTNGSNIVVDYTAQVIGHIQPGAKGRHDLRILRVPMVPGTLVVKVGGVVVEPSYVDFEAGLVVLNYDNSAGTTPLDVIADFKATGQIPGVPTNWDFKGSVGAVRILLHK